MSIEDVRARIPERWGKYVDIGVGWYGLVITLDQCLADLDPDYTIAQVKEKFGGLRYYIDTINPAVREKADFLVAFAERCSHNICEVCGAEGELNTKLSWYKTVCAKHVDKPSRNMVE